MRHCGFMHGKPESVGNFRLALRPKWKQVVGRKD